MSSETAALLAARAARRQARERELFGQTVPDDAAIEKQQRAREVMQALAKLDRREPVPSNTRWG